MYDNYKDALTNPDLIFQIRQLDRDTYPPRIRREDKTVLHLPTHVFCDVKLCS